MRRREIVDAALHFREVQRDFENSRLACADCVSTCFRHWLGPVSLGQDLNAIWPILAKVRQNERYLILLPRQAKDRDLIPFAGAARSAQLR